VRGRVIGVDERLWPDEVLWSDLNEQAHSVRGRDDELTRRGCLPSQLWLKTRATLLVLLVTVRGSEWFNINDRDGRTLRQLLIFLVASAAAVMVWSGERRLGHSPAPRVGTAHHEWNALTHPLGGHSQQGEG